MSYWFESSQRRDFLVLLKLKNSSERRFAPPAAPDFSRDNMSRCRGLLLFVKIPQIGFGRKVDVSLITNSVTSLLLL